MTCNNVCCSEHPNWVCYLPTSHFSDHNDGHGHLWLNPKAPQLNTENNQLKQEKETA